MFPEEYTVFTYISDCDEIDLFDEVNSLVEKIERLENSDWEILV